MPIVTPIDPLKPHVTIAIAAPDARWSKGVMVIGGGYVGGTDAEMRAYFEEMSDVAPGTTEAGGWRIVDLPYDHGEWLPPAQTPTGNRPCAPDREVRLLEMEAIFENVLAEDDLAID